MIFLREEGKGLEMDVVSQVWILAAKCGKKVCSWVGFAKLSYLVEVLTPLRKPETLFATIFSFNELLKID